ncbi:Co-chaperone GrpE family protein [Striga hermonthica]|uniref:GrpE protein homolog n=1 Tax=Striga hermonthica TaxID=68872 RepID=A0A9N7R944_STRHE|nr:Co-chaperone GrpE family protein [Striga hermonthica]
MAASASLSTAFSLYTPHTFPRSSSSTPTNHLSLKHTASQQFITTAKPFSRTAVSWCPVFSSNKKFRDSTNLNGVCEDEKRSFTKLSVSRQQENQPQQLDNEEEYAASKRVPLKLKALMQAYKEAILLGDGGTIYEIEGLIFAVENEKNELAQKVLAMSADISSGKEKYLRVQADFDNYRKRVEKERLTVRTDAQGEVMESLLPMVDSFERAKQQLKLETEREKKIDTSYQGIYKQFVEIMRSLRVSVVPTVGKPFDPKMHEAIAREESQDFKEGIIIQEFRKGFYLGERLLRPAMVKVSSGPGKKPTSVLEQSSAQQASVAGIDNR